MTDSWLLVVTYTSVYIGHDSGANGSSQSTFLNWNLSASHLRKHNLPTYSTEKQPFAVWRVAVNGTIMRRKGPIFLKDPNLYSYQMCCRLLNGNAEQTGL